MATPSSTAALGTLPGPPVSLPAHLGYAHAVEDSVLGIAIGVLLVALYVAALRFLADRDDRSNGRERDDRRAGS